MSRVRYDWALLACFALGACDRPAPPGVEAEPRLDLQAGGELPPPSEAPVAEGLGWLPTERYVGVSGATIRPDLYLAVGISGQVQHMAGVNHAKVIVAINRDKNAPVFGQADLGVVGDLYDVLPALTNALAH